MLMSQGSKGGICSVRFAFQLFPINFETTCITCSYTNDHIKMVVERLAIRGDP